MAQKIYIFLMMKHDYEKHAGYFSFMTSENKKIKMKTKLNHYQEGNGKLCDEKINIKNDNSNPIEKHS